LHVVPIVLFVLIFDLEFAFHAGEGILMDVATHDLLAGVLEVIDDLVDLVTFIVEREGKLEFVLST
jgi:hypothetical protein